MISNITRQNLPYTRRCWKCNILVEIPRDARYESRHKCTCGNLDIKVSKPNDNITIKQGINTTYSKTCIECQDIMNGIMGTTTVRCKCGYTILQPYKSGFKLGVLRSSNNSWERGPVPLDWFSITKIRLYKFKGNDNRWNTNKHIDGDHILSIAQSSRKSIFGRLERACLDIVRAFALDERPRFKQRSDSFFIRSVFGHQSNLTFNLDAKTITVDDMNGYVKFHYNPLTKKIDSIMDWRGGDHETRNSGYLNSMCSCLSDMGLKLEAPINMGTLGGPKWEGIMCNKLEDLSDASGYLKVRNHYYRSFITDSYKNYQRFFKRYQKEFTFIHDDRFQENVNKFRSVFGYCRYTDRNFILFKRAIESQDTLDTLFSSKERIRKAKGLPSQAQYRNLDKNHQENIIRQQGRDKCILCNNKIHSISAYNAVPIDQVLGDEKNRFGVLCCSCYHQQSQLLLDYKNTVHEMKKNKEI